MTKRVEYRQSRVEIRLDEDVEGRVVADVLRYSVLDDYGTKFRPGCFTESLEARMPRIVWAHDWRDPIGRWVDADDNDERLRLTGELDSLADVPSARRAYVQMKSGTIDQFSVGFMRQADETKDDGVWITKGQLDEASPVLVGAVPGTQLVDVRRKLVLATRSLAIRESKISIDAAANIILRMQTGVIDIAEALTELKNAASSEPDDDDNESSDDDDNGNDDETPSDDETEIDELLDAALSQVANV